jgi:predicted small lipoprotein YifL
MKSFAATTRPMRSRDNRLMNPRRWRIACAGIALLLLWGCGQKGPLYLPDKKGSTVAKPVTASPEAATPPEKIDPEKKDDNEIPPTP